MQRRSFLKMTGTSGASLALVPGVAIPQWGFADSVSTIRIHPAPRFEISPGLFMQFMEPLGVTDSSVEAAWDHQSDKWRDDVIQATKELAPGMIRWGGILSSYYRWKEAVGPRDKRKPMLNIQWNGIESNQVGTAEFVDFCRQVKADPLMSVNFESDGYPGWAVTKKGDIRRADAREAAEWVDYCNNPSNKKRIKHGFKDPFDIKIWQLGNETSYGRDKFDNETAARKTVEFSKAMRKADPSIKIIAWGDSDWSPKMSDIAGDHFDYLAFHHMFDPGRETKNSPLRDNRYREDPSGTWEILMNGVKVHENRINRMREEVAPLKKPIALTECHYALPGRNRCEVLSSWAAGVSYARLMNLHVRNGDLLKIATLADFCGTRWQVNAVMIPVPGGKSFLMPVAKIMKLYRDHSGKDYLDTTGSPEALDITASRTGNTVYLYVVNTNRDQPVKTQISIDQMAVLSGKIFELQTDPQFEILSAANDPLIPSERILKPGEPVEFKAASVTAIEMTVA